ncbi:MAG: hypothetical protein IJ418_18140 [Clostridia bacterium]|nr:hypothetical protein [Clostridia bacterium]
MNRKLIALALCLLLLVPAFGCAQELSVVLPNNYETSGQNYPVIYLLPQSGHAMDDSGLTDKLLWAMEEQLGLEMIIVKPQFDAQDDPAAVLRSAIEQTDAQYRTAKDPQYRVLMGTGVGGYMAYALGLDMPEEIGAMVSIRGNFAGEDNPWLETLGSVYDAVELANLSNPEYLNTVYTYMDAPVEDDYTDQPGSTNDLGAMFIGFGTGSASHEFTVRPGAFDDAFLTESVTRVMNRLTMRMMAGAVSGTLTLEKAALSAADKTATALYSVYTGESLAALSPVVPPLELVFTVTDSQTGEVLDQQTVTNAALEGGCVIANKVNGTSSTVTLSARLLNTKIQLASATLIRMQDPVFDGDVQKIDLMGDWQFNYTSMETLDVASLTADEIAQWSSVQPGITGWAKGFGNISDENVSSPYGPDYFSFFITGSGYYAKTFTLPAEFDSDDVLLSIGYVDDRCEVYLNGTRVGATGMDESGQPTGDTTWAVYSCFEIDEALLVRGGENTVVVRAWNDLPFGAGGWYGGPTALYSRAAFELENGGASERFYEESFTSEYAAKGLGKSGAIENNYLIHLPAGYETSSKRYPTVYLLHQFNSDHTSYRGDKVNLLFDAGAKEGLFDEMIVVIPNSSEESWWTGDWEKMIVEELIPHIDEKYRTIRDARYRLTVGCSMGGQGAMAVALRNPDFFTGAVSFFGAFSYGGASSPNAIAAKESTEYMDSFSLYFICGNQDSYGFGVPAIELHQQLDQMGVNHRFFIDNGGHDSAFYLPFFKDAFSYIRSDMYKSDEAIESLIKGGLTVVGTQVTAKMETLPGIEAYQYTVPASSYTKDQNPQLDVALTLTVTQNGKTALQDRTSHHSASDQISVVIETDLAAHVDASQPFEVTLTANILDRTIELAKISK